MTAPAGDALDPPSGGAREGAEVRVPVGPDELFVVNEFSLARVRKVRTRNGERLEIHSPRLGHTIRLDAIELEALSWQSPDAISRLIASSRSARAPSGAAGADGGEQDLS